MPEATIHKTSSGISRNQILYLLFCCYVFFAPFEDLLEYLYGIKTIFKPYRAFGLLILLFGFFFRFRSKRFFIHKDDAIAMGFVVYALLYTVFIYSLGFRVNFSHIINSQLQIFFLFMIHLTYKRVDLTYRQGKILFGILSSGILINGAIILVDFYVLHLSSREKGLSDNSNYAALGQVIASIYLVYQIMKRDFRFFNLKNIFFFSLLSLLFFTILATGSRGGFLMFVICLFIFLVILTNAQTKVRLLPIGAIVVGVILYSTAYQSLTEKVTTFNRLKGASQDIRIPLAKAGINAIEDSYGMGIGVNQMVDRKTFAKYMEPVDRNLVFGIEQRDRGLSLHNMYIEILVESGFIGLGLWLLYLFRVLNFQWQKFKIPGPEKGFHRMLLVCMMTVFLAGVTAKCLLGALFWFVISSCSREYTSSAKKSSAQIA